MVKGRGQSSEVDRITVQKEYEYGQPWSGLHDEKNAIFSGESRGFEPSDQDALNGLGVKRSQVQILSPRLVVYKEALRRGRRRVFLWAQDRRLSPGHSMPEAVCDAFRPSQTRSARLNRATPPGLLDGVSVAPTVRIYLFRIGSGDQAPSDPHSTDGADGSCDLGTRSYRGGEPGMLVRQIHASGPPPPAGNTAPRWSRPRKGGMKGRWDGGGAMPADAAAAFSKPSP